jgi:hypothetical protein
LIDIGSATVLFPSAAVMPGRLLSVFLKQSLRLCFAEFALLQPKESGFQFSNSFTDNLDRLAVLNYKKAQEGRWDWTLVHRLDGLTR